jgi:hypothetical protein
MSTREFVVAASELLPLALLSGRGSFLLPSSFLPSLLSLFNARQPLHDEEARGHYQHSTNDATPCATRDYFASKSRYKSAVIPIPPVAN